MHRKLTNGERIIMGALMLIVFGGIAEGIYVVVHIVSKLW